jgi:hypothetical protein
LPPPASSAAGGGAEAGTRPAAPRLATVGDGWCKPNAFLSRHAGLWIVGVCSGFRGAGKAQRPAVPPGSRRGASMEKGTGSERSEVPVPLCPIRERMECGVARGGPCQSSWRRKPSAARMAKRGFSERSEGQDAQSKRPARWYQPPRSLREPNPAQWTAVPPGSRLVSDGWCEPNALLLRHAGLRSARYRVVAATAGSSGLSVAAGVDSAMISCSRSPASAAAPLPTRDRRGETASSAARHRG